jgi:2-polyprenyl-3-methyl-5-hydroxy-6-metoxy-1,4-benzoquinol methylase
MSDRDLPDAEASSNLLKYQTGNPVVRRLINHFYDAVCARAVAARPRTILDAGCGEGEAVSRLRALLPDCQITGIDTSGDALDHARRRCPGTPFLNQSVLALDFAADSFDLVLCLEVLEHLERPRLAIAELARVARGPLVLSVPHEPWFRLGSLARGKYLAGWGNHPEHIQQFTPRTFEALLGGQLSGVEVATSFPWIVGQGHVLGSTR